MRPFLTLHDPARAQGFYAAGLWRDETFYTLLARHAGTRPGAIALRDGRQTLDWESLKARVDAMADDLLDSGLVAGDRVAIWMSNRVEAVIAFLACAREGLACNPSLHRSYTCGEIVTLLDSIGASALVTEPGWGADRPDKDFAAMVGAVGTIRRVYTPADWPLCITRAPRAHRGNPDAVAYLAFTSGTTGRPKCVMHSSNTLLANARELARDWMLDDESVILSLSPLSHHIAWVAIGQWLVCGGQMVTDDPPPGTSRLDWIVAVGATYVLGVPTHAMELLAEQRRRDIARLGVVRTFYMAGAPIPEIVAQGFVDQGIAPQNIYGMTECSSHQYTHPDDPVATWVATCGRGGSAYEVRIWDPADADREMRPGETGEIGGRGACLMLGYYANQAATDASFNRHGYLMSGDLGSFDGNGNLRIEGRTKDVVIRGGHNIHPARIETLALTHPAVEKAAAFGVADARLGEKVCLAIVGAVDADAMLDHLGAEELSKFDMPEWFVALDAMPLTASGKILKRELAAMVARGDIAPRPVRYAAKTGNMDTGSMTTGSMA